MGAALSHRSNKCDEELLNPISGLTPSDVQNVKQSWSTIFAHPEQNGMELFKRLFRADPEAKHLFVLVRNMDEQQFSTNAQFRAHVIDLMTWINSVISNLEDPEVAVAMLHKLGHSHKKHQVLKKHFDALEKVLSEYMSKDLKLSSAVQHSWNRVIQFMYQHIFKTLHPC